MNTSKSVLLCMITCMLMVATGESLGQPSELQDQGAKGANYQTLLDDLRTIDIVEAHKGESCISLSHKLFSRAMTKLPFQQRMATEIRKILPLNEKACIRLAEKTGRDAVIFMDVIHPERDKIFAPVIQPGDLMALVFRNGQLEVLLSKGK